MADDEFSEVFEEIIQDLYQRAAEPGPRPDDRNYLMGADGAFLGKITSNRYDAEGILNEYGPFGSKYSSTSINNPYGPYGSKYSAKSPWNPYATDPPKIYRNNRFVGLLTKNRFKPQAVDPDEFLKQVKTDAQLRY